MSAGGITPGESSLSRLNLMIASLSVCLKQTLYRALAVSAILSKCFPYPAIFVSHPYRHLETTVCCRETKLSKHSNSES